MNELIIGKTYLCEIWAVPPEIECNGVETKLGIFKFLGYNEFGNFQKTIYCNDKPVIKLAASEKTTIWSAGPNEIFRAGDLVWRLVPIKVLEQEEVNETSVVSYCSL